MNTEAINDTPAQINPAALVNNQNPVRTRQSRGKADFGKFLNALRTKLSETKYLEFTVKDHTRKNGIDPGIMGELRRKELIHRSGDNPHSYKYKLDPKLGTQTKESIEKLYRDYIKRGVEEREIKNPQKYGKKRTVAEAKQAVETGMQYNPEQDITPAEWNNGLSMVELLSIPAVEATPPLKQLTTSWEIDGKKQGVSITVTGIEGDDPLAILKKGLGLLDYSC